MPLDIDRFEADDPVSDPPTSERIIRFLAANDDRAYTRRELADALDADPETVGTNLTRLKNQSLVRHREPYWAFTDDRDDALEVLADRFDDLASILDDSSESSERLDDPTGRSDVVVPEAASPNDSEQRGSHRDAAKAYMDRVQGRLTDNVEGLYLFGSVARQSETTSSDVDILAVIADEADFGAIDEVLLDLAYDVQLEYGVRVEVHSIRASEFAARRDRGDPFVRRVLEEAKLGG